MMSPHDRYGSKAVRLRPSKCFPVCVSKQTQGFYEYTPSYFPAQNSQGFCRRQNLRKAGNLQGRTNFWVDANPFGLSSRRRGSCEGGRFWS